ncbi:MAG: 4-hydroxy-tetrahydrodipicolinate reductase, partial [bacterium]
MSAKVRVAVSGAAGRMGSAACEAIDFAEGLELVGRADPSTGDDLVAAIDSADVLVDLTTPDAALKNAVQAVEEGVDTVVGTTGFDLDDLRSRIEASSGESRCLVVPNFAIGAVLRMGFAAEAAKFFEEGEIVEMHHPAKLDAPSGTAKRTAEMIESAGGSVSAPIHSVRLSGLVAHQEVIFGGEGETLTIRHDALDRSCFMPGILLAARRIGSLEDRFT